MGDREAVIIDPGAQAKEIVSMLGKISMVPKYILLTHGHFDHIGAIPQLLEALAPVRPQIAVHRLDAQYLGPDAYEFQKLNAKAALGDTSLIDESWRDMPPPDILLEEGSVIGPLTVMHLPGHTPGSVGFWDKTENSLFSGDTMFKGNHGRTDLPGGSEKDILASIQRMLVMDANTSIYPGHGNVTSIGRELKGGGYPM